MPQLDWYLTDLGGNRIAEFPQGVGDVQVPLNGSRTARCKVSLDEADAKYVEEMSTVLRADLLFVNDDAEDEVANVFAGQVGRPSYNGPEYTLDIPAIDPGHRVSRNPLLNALSYIGQTPRDREVIEALIKAAEPTPAELALGIPGLGIRYEADPANYGGGHVRHGGELYNIGQDPLAAAYAFTQLLDGPDISLTPLDPQVYGASMVQLALFVRQGSDRTDQVIFEHRYGANNAGVVIEPGADVVANRALETGAALADGTLPRYQSEYRASQIRRGIWGRHNANSDTQDVNVLKARAMLRTAGYGDPPMFFTITPYTERDRNDPNLTDERGVPPEVFKTYWIGDDVSAVAALGDQMWEVGGRINNIGLANQGADVKTTLTCVPRVGATEVT